MIIKYFLIVLNNRFMITLILTLLVLRSDQLASSPIRNSLEGYIRSGSITPANLHPSTNSSLPFSLKYDITFQPSFPNTTNVDVALCFDRIQAVRNSNNQLYVKIQTAEMSVSSFTLSVWNMYDPKGQRFSVMELGIRYLAIPKDFLPGNFIAINIEANPKQLITKQQWYTGSMPTSLTGNGIIAMQYINGFYLRTNSSQQAFSFYVWLQINNNNKTITYSMLSQDGIFLEEASLVILSFNRTFINKIIKQNIYSRYGGQIDINYSQMKFSQNATVFTGLRSFTIGGEALSLYLNAFTNNSLCIEMTVMDFQFQTYSYSLLAFAEVCTLETPFYFEQTTLCYDECPPKCAAFEDNYGKHCVSCRFDCLTCANNNTDVCLSCDKENDFRQLQNENCVCLEGYFDKGTSVCSKCLLPSCQLCESDSKCAKCSNGYYFGDDGECYSSCADGFIQNETSMRCLKCSQNCSSCVSDTQCINCHEGTFQVHLKTNNNTICVEKCQQIYYFYSKKKCIQCPQSCKECDKYGVCLPCPQNYYLNRWDSCSQILRWSGLLAAIIALCAIATFYIVLHLRPTYRVDELIEDVIQLEECYNNQQLRQDMLRRYGLRQVAPKPQIKLIYPIDYLTQLPLYYLHLFYFILYAIFQIVLLVATLAKAKIIQVSFATAFILAINVFSFLEFQRTNPRTITLNTYFYSQQNKIALILEIPFFLLLFLNIPAVVFILCLILLQLFIFFKIKAAPIQQFGFLNPYFVSIIILPISFLPFQLIRDQQTDLLRSISLFYQPLLSVYYPIIILANFPSQHIVKMKRFFWFMNITYLYYLYPSTFIFLLPGNAFTTPMTILFTLLLTLIFLSFLLYYKHQIIRLRCNQAPILNSTIFQLTPNTAAFPKFKPYSRNCKSFSSIEKILASYQSQKIDQKYLRPDTCNLCFSRECSVAYQQCLHVCACLKCAKRLKRKNNCLKCPICNQESYSCLIISRKEDEEYFEYKKGPFTFQGILKKNHYRYEQKRESDDLFWLF